VKGKRLLDADPAGLSDDDLDIQVGALAEELEHMNNETDKLDRVRGDLASRRASLTARIASARAERDGRGRGPQ
jgi:hypothetical protein